MQVADIRAFFVRVGRRREQSQNNLAAYSTLVTSSRDFPNSPMTAESSIEDSSFDGYHIDRSGAALSRLSQFLSHFTLGFADGLTVPFALTAGLSSLGQTKTVIYAGMAEICAGCISMGISGYLAAKGVTTTTTDSRDHGEKLDVSEQDSVQRYLAPLDLPQDLLECVKAHIDYHPVVSQRLRNMASTADELADKARNLRFPPVIVGLSVALGYMIGGLLPLLPYFFVDEVGEGLRWSFVVCILALFVFGFMKDYLLRPGSNEEDWEYGETRREAATWEMIKQGWWEGMRMVVMGGLAAVAAVLCVKLFETIML
ncbi:DUF125-domain-containing protein [Hypomontagnella monticulosa]|nr:DUF125-domain-containing protein [Hypomontagnella monticulosa]